MSTGENGSEGKRGKGTKEGKTGILSKIREEERNLG